MGEPLRVAAMATAIVAATTVMAPFGISRFMVRGLRASKMRSAIRLNPIAAKRAAENATITSATVRTVSGTARDAASTPTSANGSANTVWGSFTNEA